MKTYHVYLLRCADDSYYTGITNDLARRVEEHQLGVNTRCYTFSRRPVVLVFAGLFTEVGQAIAFEKQVKGWTRRKKEALIRGEYAILSALASCRNETAHYFFGGSSGGSNDSKEVEGNALAPAGR